MKTEPTRYGGGLRLVFILLGVLTAVSGIAAFLGGHFGMSEYAGADRLLAGPSLGLVAGGVLFILLGMILWRKSPGKQRDQ
jgi:hypothetical protein